jgi:hypothetical protein
MPGLNKTGLANTSDYNLGRGKLYLATLTNGIPGPYRDLGNCPEFNVSLENERLDHQSSRSGLRVTDKSVVVSQTVNINFTLDELNFQNLALFFSGESADEAITNPAIAGVTERELVASAPDFTDFDGPRWYDLKNASGVRCYDIATANLTLASDTAGADNTLVEGTDYAVDEKNGRVMFLSTTTLIDEGDDITFTLAADAGAVNPDEVRALTQTTVTAALKFISENPANNDAQTEYQFHQVQLSAEGDLALIGDEYSTMGFTAVAESNETADANSPTLTIRQHAN